jgi:DNA-binding MarR family transcriptional regulator
MKSEIMEVVNDEIKKHWKPREKAMSAIRNNKALSPLQKIMLDTFVRCNEKSYKPTLLTLAAQFKVTKNWIQKTLNKLEALGYIEIIHKSETDNNNCLLLVHPIPINVEKDNEKKE